MSLITDGLNEQQLEAANEFDRSVLVMAGAGSGKTKVLTTRVANLIANGRALPYQILVFTFTNKAASELKSRLYSMNITNVQDIWVGTFHSICAKILRRHARLLGYEPNFVIYDTADQKALLKRVIKDEKSAIEASEMQHYVSKFKNGSKMAFRAEEERIVREYNRRLKESNAMDFDDLILLVIKLFEENPDVKDAYNRRFSYIHVDEYQDTNKSQFELIKSLAGGYNEERGMTGNVFAVGDIDQSIYKWRGADISNIQDFEKDFKGARLVILEQNYRSTQNILSAANSIIAYNTERPEKNLWTDKGAGDKIRFYLADSDDDEAHFVVREITQIGDYYGLNNIAVLYRNNSQSRKIEFELRARGVPYNVYGGLRFFERREIKDMLAYLRLIYNPMDESAFARAIAVPKRGVGAKSLDRIYDYAQAHHISVIDACLQAEEIKGLPKKAREQVIFFATKIMDIRKDADSLGIDEIFQAVLDFSGIIPSLEEEDTTEADVRIDNIYEFQDYVNENAPVFNLSEFLEDSALRSAQDEVEDDEDSVTLMTIHTAKGLEYDVVFLIGLCEGVLPNKKSMEEDRDVEEERRLCYVAITRARKLLYLTSMKYRYLYNHGEQLAPSRFLGELPLTLLDNLGTNELTEGSFWEEKEFNQSRINVGGYDDGPYYAVNRKKVEEFMGAKSEPAGPGPVFKGGDRVVHDVFGNGIVVDVEGEKIRVAFEGQGIKLLNPKLAPIKKRY